MEIAFVVALILLNGLFAMSEIALVTARRARLEKLAEDGDRAARVALGLADEPTRFLSTVQIGITAIGILNGILGEAALADPLAAMLRTLGVGVGASGVAATAIVVVSITYLSIVIGELVPKRLAQFNAEGIARTMARPLWLLAQASRPFVFLLSASTDALLRVMGKGGASEAAVTEEDIHALLIQGSRAGVIEKHEHEMVRNIFRLDDRQIASLMTPRSEIVFLDIDQPFDEELERLIASDHSRFPVCRGGMDEVLGVITAKRLLKQNLSGAPADITGVVLPPVFVPETLTGMKLLEEFRQSGVQMVFVVDEYGEVLGLVTVQDLLEALAGEFRPRDAEDVWVVAREDGSMLLDGLLPVPELKDRLGFKSVPEEDRGRYHTLGGMMMWLMGRVPHTGDATEWEGWRLEVVDLDRNRVDKILATPLPPRADVNGEGAGG